MLFGQALRWHVQPGMTIHLGLACTPPRLDEEARLGEKVYEEII